MNFTGTQLDGLEVGNAWDLRDETRPDTNWVIGEFPTIAETSLRFIRQSNPTEKRAGAIAQNVAVKWFVHSIDDPTEWGQNKPTSEGRTLSILAGAGEFQLHFSQGNHACIVTLNTPGDFAIWGPGLEHSWQPLQTSPILTLRWTLK